jgi:hypothetical protein
MYDFRQSLFILSVGMIWLTSCSQTHIRDSNYNYSKPIQLADGIVVDNIANSNIDSNRTWWTKNIYQQRIKFNRCNYGW